MIYTIFGKTKNLKIFEFNRPVNNQWQWSRNYNGKWDFKFKIRLPPPVSFISINFLVRIKYNFNIKLFSKKVSNSPYRFKLGTLVTTGI